MVPSSISLNLSLSQLNFAVPLKEGHELFHILCRHKSRNRDKPTILNTLATVGVWNGNILHLAEPIPMYLSQISLSPLNKDTNDFTSSVGKKSGNRDKPTILNTLAPVGVWNGNIFHLPEPIPILPKFLSLSCPNFAISCLNKDANDFAFSVGTRVEIGTYQLSFTL